MAEPGFLTRQLDRLAEFSCTDPDTQGVTRLPFTPEQEGAAHWLAEQMDRLGMSPRIDPCGTVAGVFPGKKEEVLIIGSHYDSVPNGGRYDGCAGIIAALEAVRRLKERGERPQYTLMVLALNDEEGVRLTEGFLSSRSVCGELTAADLERIRDRETGRSLGALLDASPFRGEAVCLPSNARAYLEFHVEQGPVLDEKGLSAAVVDRIVGVYHHFYCLHGGQNHAGTTPMTSRADPVPVFGQIAARLPDIARACPGSVATIGWMEVRPNVPNVIPGSLEFSVDLRSADPEALEQLRLQTDRLIRTQAARAGLSLTHRESTSAPPVVMDRDMRRLLERCAVRLGQFPFHMDSGAGHDAQIFAQKLPAAMLFARSRAGASHCPEEFTSEEDLELACSVLYEFIKEDF